MASVYRFMSTEIFEKVLNMTEIVGYPISIINNQRIIGPPYGAPVPENGSELFISRIPMDAFEDELIPFLAEAGTIYKFRLMLTPSFMYNKGFAFVNYATKEEAETAKCILENLPFRGRYLSVDKSTDNRRLFIGGIPDTKTKDEVWKELIRAGITGIVDVIMYRSYSDRIKNRGFVFVEFRTHQEAATVRVLFKKLRLWNDNVHVDWSAPVPTVSDDDMKKVKKIFLRNLDVTLGKEILQTFLENFLGKRAGMEKVYKFKDYAFVHFETRRDAQHALYLLKDHFRKTDVEVSWAIPQEFAKKCKNQIPGTTSAVLQNISVFDPASSSVETTNNSFSSTSLNTNVRNSDWQNNFLPVAWTHQENICLPSLLDSVKGLSTNTDTDEQVMKLFDSSDH